MSEALKYAARRRLQEVIAEIEGKDNGYGYGHKTGGMVHKVESARIDVLTAERAYTRAQERLAKLQADRQELEEFLNG